MLHVKCGDLVDGHIVQKPFCALTEDFFLITKPHLAGLANLMKQIVLSSISFTMQSLHNIWHDILFLMFLSVPIHDGESPNFSKSYITRLSVY